MEMNYKSNKKKRDVNNELTAGNINLENRYINDTTRKKVKLF